MRNATIEAEVREEVSREMAETMQKMHKDFSQRFQEQVSDFVIHCPADESGHGRGAQD